MMMRAAGVSRRSALAVLRANVAHRHHHEPIVSAARHISFLPWKRKPAPQAIPVYFQTAASTKPKAPLSRRLGRGILTIFIYYMCAQIFLSVVIDPLLDWAELEWAQLSDKEKAELAEQSDDERTPLLFLPFPFTTETIEQPPYRGSDPEWKEFLAVNKSPELQERMKSQLADQIRRNIELNPAYHRLLGSKTVSIKKYWLDIIYPSRPPPVHHVSGLMVMEDGIYWGPQPIDAMSANSLEKVLYPKAVAIAAWTMVSTLAQQTVSSMSRVLGVPSPVEDPPMPPSQQRRLEEFKTQRGDSWKSASETVDNVLLHTAFHTVAALQKNWVRTSHPPTKGCIRVDGIIEVKGKTAIMSVYVVGWYDPKQRKYTSVQTRLKHLLPLLQRPARP